MGRGTSTGWRDGLGILRLRLVLPLLFRQGSLTDLLRELEGHSPRPAGAPRPRAADLVPLVERLMRPLRFWHTTCLWRSLAGYAALRAAGDEVRFLIGVRKRADGELEAHAWLERGGRPSLGAPSPGEGYRVAFSWPTDPATLELSEEHPVPGLHVSDDAVLTELADGTGVVLDLRSKQYFTLNRTGVIAWKLVATGEAREASAVAGKLADRFPSVPRADVERDVRAMLDELVAEQLLVVRP